MRFPGSPLCPRFCSSVPSPIIPIWIMGRRSLASLFASFGSGLSVTGKSFVLAVSGSRGHPTRSQREASGSESTQSDDWPHLRSSSFRRRSRASRLEEAGPPNSQTYWSGRRHALSLLPGIPCSRVECTELVGKWIAARTRRRAPRGVWRDGPLLWAHRRSSQLSHLESSLPARATAAATMRNMMWRALTGATVL